MKRTTYIMIGLFVSGLVVVVIAMILGVTLKTEYKKDGLFQEDEHVEMKLDGVRVVKMLVNQGEINKPRDILIDGQLSVTPSTGTGKEIISYPKSRNLKVAQRNDTLIVEFDFRSSQLSEKMQKQDYIYAVGVDVRLVVDTLKSIISYTDGLKLNMKCLESDSLFIRTNRQDVSLDSCRFRSFNIAGKGLIYHAKNSRIENVYLNLDSVWVWKFENSVIGTEYLSGSDVHSSNLQKGECQRVVWTPLKDDACLQINLREKSVIDIVAK